VVGRFEGSVPGALNFDGKPGVMTSVSADLYGNGKTTDELSASINDWSSLNDTGMPNGRSRLVSEPSPSPSPALNSKALGRDALRTSGDSKRALAGVCCARTLPAWFTSLRRLERESNVTSTPIICVLYGL
jgi:hypothetical protein